MQKFIKDNLTWHFLNLLFEVRQQLTYSGDNKMYKNTKKSNLLERVLCPSSLLSSRQYHYITTNSIFWKYTVRTYHRMVTRWYWINVVWIATLYIKYTSNRNWFRAWWAYTIIYQSFKTHWKHSNNHKQNKMVFWKWKYTITVSSNNMSFLQALVRFIFRSRPLATKWYCKDVKCCINNNLKTKYWYFFAEFP